MTKGESASIKEREWCLRGDGVEVVVVSAVRGDGLGFGRGGHLLRHEECGDAHLLRRVRKRLLHDTHGCVALRRIKEMRRQVNL